METNWCGLWDYSEECGTNCCGLWDSWLVGRNVETGLVLEQLAL